MLRRSSPAVHQTSDVVSPASPLEATLKRTADKAEVAKIQGVFERIENLFTNTTGTTSAPSIEPGSLPEDFPNFLRDEMTTGARLGRGCFSEVFEITHFQTKHKVDSDNMDSCAFVSSRCLTSIGEARFALKTPRKDVLEDPYQSWLNFADLLVETRLLSQLEHPNIIKLRAIADSSVPSPDYFIVLDRLYDTLRVRMEKWKSHGNFLQRFIKRRGTRSTRFFEERLVHALHLTSALEYMHEQRVIHRDIKPENVGFSVSDEIKIFDLGLSRPIPSTDDVYRLSMAGSLRYMAPEVFKQEAYNQACDIYSFTLLFWEMLTLQKPYIEFKDVGKFKQRVFRTGIRPKTPRSWSRSLKELVNAGWEHDPYQRPSMKTMRSLLKSELYDLSTDKISFEDRRRRSTKVYEFKGHRRQLVKIPSKEDLAKVLTEVSLLDDDDSFSQ